MTRKRLAAVAAVAAWTAGGSARRSRPTGRGPATWGWRQASSRLGRSTPSPTSRACSVGHVTLREGDGVRTGVTAVVPHGGNLFQDKVPGAVFVGNAFGKLAGSTQVEELGTIETPIVLTNTLGVGRGRSKASCNGRWPRPATPACGRSTRWWARPTTAA